VSLTDELYALDTDTWSMIRAWRYTRRQAVLLGLICIGALVTVTAIMVVTVGIVSIIRLFGGPL
jgi:uncharacterized membrane protein